MLVFQGMNIALRALRENKLRTFLTLLGNIVGTMSVIAVVSLIGGIDDYVKEEVAGEGSNVFTIERFNFFEAITDLDAFLEALARNPRIKLSDVDYMRDRIPSASYVAAAADGEEQVSYRDEWVDRISIRGRSEEYPMIEEAPLHIGRHISRLEDQKSADVAVLGWEVYTRLFPRGGDPTGTRIKINRKHFSVIGVVEDLGTVLGESKNRFVYIPVNTFLKIYGTRTSIEIKVKAADITLLQQAVDEATMAMRIRHGLRPMEEDDFAVVTSENLISLWEKISTSIFNALIFIVSIALVVGGVVLMNVMLVSVTERTREVGLRKALGARKSNIIWQFIVESITLSLVGGIIGILIGFTIAAIISILSPLPYIIAPWSIAAGLIVTFMIGLVFGTYPASKAANLDPVVALHYE
ncbi:MAG TPA: FtsX-like permease family protein [Candidatus Eisenbacteria bacterium]|uniref:FtsX-like permease family protein n=1 Tax=Eiseniibacteriota bacterium TaxID=2212470 RepID=A0A7V2AW97_UNCEI|nr:FtsX-like permease family protein [Candidatus Eisenbacteria bacterium]